MENRKPQIKQSIDLKAIFRKSYAGRFVSPIDIDDKPATVKIRGFGEENLQSWQKGSEARDRLIIYFEKTERGLVLNKTNFRKLVELFGWATENWVGKEITLAAGKTKAFGRVVDTIEVRPAGPVNSTLAKEGIEQPVEGHGEEVVNPEEVPV